MRSLLMRVNIHLALFALLYGLPGGSGGAPVIISRNCGGTVWGCPRVIGFYLWGCPPLINLCKSLDRASNRSIVCTTASYFVLVMGCK